MLSPIRLICGLEGSIIRETAVLNSVFLDRKCRACDCEARNASEPLLPKSMEAGRRPRGLPAPGALQPATCTDSLPRRAVCRLRALLVWRRHFCRANERSQGIGYVHQACTSDKRPHAGSFTTLCSKDRPSALTVYFRLFTLLRADTQVRDPGH